MELFLRLQAWVKRFRSFVDPWVLWAILQCKMCTDAHLEYGHFWHVHYVCFVHSTLTTSLSIKSHFCPSYLLLATFFSNASSITQWRSRISSACSSSQVDWILFLHYCRFFLKKFFAKNNKKQCRSWMIASKQRWFCTIIYFILSEHKCRVSWNLDWLWMRFLNWYKTMLMI